MSKASNKFFQFLFIFLWFVASATALEIGGHSFRDTLCLNGYWEFQGVDISDNWKRGEGVPPLFPPIEDGKWEDVKLKIPSPWNVNTWGGGRDVGTKEHNKYWPDSVYFPSYPESWDKIEMGRVRRSFELTEKRASSRYLLHFQSVAGECTIYLNGKRIGSHFDKFLPFEFDVTDSIKSGTNEVLLEIRSHLLFDKQSKRFPKMRATYPCGSETHTIVGITEDVNLVCVPEVYIDDIYIKPLLDENRLEIEITIQNATAQNISGAGLERKIDIATNIIPAKNSIDNSNERIIPGLQKKLADTAIKPGKTLVKLSIPIAEGQLKYWFPDNPELYYLEVRLIEDAREFESVRERFGWRQFKIVGPELRLNGKKIQLLGDLLHPFGPFIYDPGYVRAWYQMVKDMGGNAVRPHAQIHPRIFLDLADEMGILVLDETAIFGSSIALNFEEPITWERFEQHFAGLIKRDRNHPSVFGWSFGNELFAIFNLNRVPPKETAEYYAKIVALGKLALELDPSREWISCDGDEDLDGRIPVWSKHFGHGNSLERLPKNLNKPLMVGESGGTYYASPKQLSVFNGKRAFESYLGRSEALAIDVYENITQMAKPHLAFFSASETAWFGLEHLNFGYDDFTRRPNLEDGIFLNRNYIEGKPGIQIERIPPYVATFNPGWDENLPLYKPLPMFLAQKAAIESRPNPFPRPLEKKNLSEQPPMIYDKAAFLGSRDGRVFKRMKRIGVPFLDENETDKKSEFEKFAIVDISTVDVNVLEYTKKLLESVYDSGGTVVFPLGNPDPAAEGRLKRVLPFAVSLAKRLASSLISNFDDWREGLFDAQGLYFAEEGSQCYIANTTFETIFESPNSQNLHIKLEAADVDWSLFNNAPEHSKCASMVLYEKLGKPPEGVLGCFPHGKGTIILCTIDERNESRAATRLMRNLFTSMQLALDPEQRGFLGAIEEDELSLLNVLALGRLSPEDAEKAITEIIDPNSVPPKENDELLGQTWKLFRSPSKDRIIFNWIEQDGPREDFVEILSFWIKSPRSLDDLLGDGPDAPDFRLHLYVDKECDFHLNGKKLQAVFEDKADYRRHLVFDEVILKKGWNHLVFKVNSNDLEGERPGTIAVRLGSSNREFLESLESAVERPPLE